MYLSGIEMSLQNCTIAFNKTPNCTLVELKFDEYKGWLLDGQTPNCTLVELKLKRVKDGKITINSKLYLSGIEISSGVVVVRQSLDSKLYLSGIEIDRHTPIALHI